MARKQHKPEEIVAKLRQVEVLAAQGKTVAEGARAIGVTEATYYRWRSRCFSASASGPSRSEKPGDAMSAPGDAGNAPPRPAWAPQS